MINTPLTLTIAFTLACIGNIHAIRITLIPEPFGPDVPVPGTYVRAAANPFGSITLDTDFITTLPQVGSVTATAASKAFNQSLYSFTYSGFSVSWTAALHDGATAFTETFVAFSSAQDLHYDLQISYAGLFAPGDAASFSTGLGYRDDAGFLISPFGDQFKAFLDGGPFQYSFSFSGILPANKLITFVHQSALHGMIDEDGTSAAVASGFWNLKLTENHVPDAGSTVTMLAMALGGLGFMRRR